MKNQCNSQVLQVIQFNDFTLQKRPLITPNAFPLKCSQNNTYCALNEHLKSTKPTSILSLYITLKRKRKNFSSNSFWALSLLMRESGS